MKYVGLGDELGGRKRFLCRVDRSAGGRITGSVAPLCHGPIWPYPPAITPLGCDRNGVAQPGEHTHSKNEYRPVASEGHALFVSSKDSHNVGQDFIVQLNDSICLHSIKVLAPEKIFSPPDDLSLP